MADVPVTFRGFPGALLRYAWDLVKSKHDWKEPVSALVPASLVHVVCAAIEYYTATVPTLIPVGSGDGYLVLSCGYRQGPAGDH